MKRTNLIMAAAAMFCIAGQAQTLQPVLPAGKIAVFKAGTSDTNWPMITARVAPCFVQVFDPVTNVQASPLVSVAMSTNSAVPGSVWINHHAGSEGGGISRSVDRQFLALEGYVGNILSATSAKPSTDPTVARGIVTLDAFTNAISVYSSVNSWFGLPVGAATGTQDNPTGIASTDGTNFYGTGNFAGVSGELDGTLFYNPAVNDGAPAEVQNYLQAAGEARIIGGTLLVATKSAAGVASGLYDFVDPSSGNVVPLPWDPNVANPYFNFAFTNLYLNWGSQFLNVLNFDMNPAMTVVYGADQTYGIVKFTNNSGTWVQAPYYFSATNIDTLAQTAANQGCFGICVDFSGTNPVIYATTMENGGSTNYHGGFGVNSTAGHQNNNRLIKIVDTGVAPGTNVVAQTLAVAVTTNEFFGGIDFTPDLRPLINTQPAGYATTVSGSGSLMTVVAQSTSPLNYQWYENGNLMNPNLTPSATNATLDTTVLSAINDYNANGFTNQYQCVITNNYGAVTSVVATLVVTINPTVPAITSGTNLVTAYVAGNVTFAPVTASGTQPFTYQWYTPAGTLLSDDGVKYAGSTTASLSISNLAIADAGRYFVVVANAASYTSNAVDILTVTYHPAVFTPGGQPVSVTTFTNLPTSLTATETGGSLPLTNQWYKGTTLLTDGTEFTGTATPTLTIAASTTADTANNYYLVVSNPSGSVTSAVASVTVIIPPAHSQMNYSNQVYTQNFDVLPDPGTAGIAKTGLATGNGTSVNSINNPLDPGAINGVAYSLANPFDFTYPVILSSYLGGLGLSTMNGWYGAADTTANAVYSGNDGITRFGAQDGDQSTGGVIDFGLNDTEGGIVGTNRALGLITTSTTGSTSFALKLVNTSTNTLNYINIGYLAELWRNNSGSRTIQFGYQFDNTANTFTLNTQSISNNATTLVPALNISFPTSPVVTTVDGTQPANQLVLSTNNLLLSSGWQPGAALWLIWSMNYYNTGAGNGYAIDNLSFSGSVAPITAPSLGNASYSTKVTGSGGIGFNLNFSNSPGASGEFTVWATTNLALPFKAWQNLGHPTETTAGTYQFDDVQATNKPARFYKVTSP